MEKRIPGKIYYHNKPNWGNDYYYIYRYGYDSFNLYSLGEIDSEKYINHISDEDEHRLATQEEIDWLLKCEKAGKFIPKDNNKKEFSKSDNNLIPNTWYIIESNFAKSSILYYENNISNCKGLWRGRWSIHYTLQGHPKRIAKDKEVYDLLKKYASRQLKNYGFYENNRTVFKKNKFKVGDIVTVNQLTIRNNVINPKFKKYIIHGEFAKENQRCDIVEIIDNVCIIKYKTDNKYGYTQLAYYDSDLTLSDPKYFDGLTNLTNVNEFIVNTNADGTGINIDESHVYGLVNKLENITSMQKEEYKWKINEKSILDVKAIKIDTTFDKLITKNKPKKQKPYEL